MLEAQIKCFGTFWRRDLVVGDDDWIHGWFRRKSWTNEPEKPEVTINRLAGIYLLQDADRQILYVGQTNDFGRRLWEHNRNSNRGRWSHFSWFSLKDAIPFVSDEKTQEPQGAGTEKPTNEPLAIDQFEAILIEALYPPLNKRGANWTSAKEYLQLPSSSPTSLDDLWSQNKKLKRRLKKLEKLVAP